uniref:CBM20 domain-containing protein n=1 Tax=Chromera velia CCMP2878 TaxID=1169474 RepID=A0A0G4HIY3_9ALVE|eukprot:Cvel_27959.t1-p1 / transcript=Cvel_27959.t1 / gene=Cvel_27959 / organism=Chromera_velia_CCMP2878 / gene_product=Zinc finger protein 283, putative / transcript_product=Zinc finger protein 283, putative / location=Cvel_scaffold3570:936-3122(+) / protein_length=729 / sequence_SO=supercontig / SO=protein_coding / is_pseudo=false
MTIKMMEADTGVVLFACSGVEPRERQALVVVGSSSELGGWDVSRGVALHQVKNPAFSDVWMSFPIRHSAGSEVRFQFALVTPSADTESLQPMTFDDRRLVVDGLKSSSAVISTISAAASSHSRSQDCCWCVWGEPLGCGPREVEVVSGRFVLFGGRWGIGETQVSPLRLEDMVLAQQQLEPEKDTPPSVFSEIENEKENEWQKEGSIAGEKFGGPHEGDFTVSDVSLSLSGSVLSAAPSTGSWAERVGGEEREKGRETDIQPETELAERRSKASGQQVGGGGRVSLSEISEAAGGRVGVVPASETAHILMASADSAESDGESVPWGHSETFASVHLHRRGDDVMAGERVHGISDQTIRFAPAALKRWEGMRGQGVGVLGGKSAESVKGLTGRRGPFLIVGENRSSCEMQTEGASVCPSAVCEGPKRRRLSSLSVAVSESQLDMSLRRGEQTLIFPCPSIPQQHSRFPKSRLSFDSVGRNQADGACQREAAVCGLSKEEETQRGSTNWGGNTTKATKRPLCPPDRCHSDCRGAEGEHPVACNRDVQQHPAGRDGSTENIGVRRNGKKREHTREVKRDRHGNILCPHEKVRSRCKECGGKGICEHGRQRHQCKDCGGKGICEHGRQRHTCKECGGKSLCEHGRQRSKCKECGGKGICAHGRPRHQCKDCGGTSICEHGRRRCQCKECGGKSICEHGRQRYFCKDCGGGAFCVHRKDRRYCHECKQVSSLPP